MKVEDLRIGNLVKFEGKEYIVESISADGYLPLKNCSVNTCLSHCKPILLTDKYLVVFGGIKTNKEHYKFEWLPKNWYYNSRYECITHPNGTIACVYAHEMQNICFTLTSQELLFTPEL